MELINELWQYPQDMPIEICVELLHPYKHLCQADIEVVEDYDEKIVLYGGKK